MFYFFSSEYFFVWRFSSCTFLSLLNITSHFSSLLNIALHFFVHICFRSCVFRLYFFVHAFYLGGVRNWKAALALPIMIIEPTCMIEG